MIPTSTKQAVLLSLLFQFSFTEPPPFRSHASRDRSPPIILGVLLRLYRGLHSTVFRKPNSRRSFHLLRAQLGSLLFLVHHTVSLLGGCELCASSNGHARCDFQPLFIAYGLRAEVDHSQCKRIVLPLWCPEMGFRHVPRKRSHHHPHYR